MLEDLSRLADRSRPTVLGLTRIVVSLLFACHGAATLFNVLGGPHGKAPSVGEWPGWWAALIQLVGGALVLVGIATRPAALLCSGSMAYAYFSVHQENALWPIQNGGEPSAMFCWVFLLIAAVGPGSFALGSLLRRQPERQEQAARPAVA
ncbi:DoxX family protein [Kitasatospora sp. NPDC001540]|uniref:DoxX family protein n=1 Tax=Kitasatospora sp. NPDC001540 TaxID=3364014 RepID=UPI003681505D